MGGSEGCYLAYKWVHIAIWNQKTFLMLRSQVIVDFLLLVASCQSPGLGGNSDCNLSMEWSYFCPLKGVNRCIDFKFKVSIIGDWSGRPPRKD